MQPCLVLLRGHGSVSSLCFDLWSTFGRCCLCGKEFELGLSSACGSQLLPSVFSVLVLCFHFRVLKNPVDHSITVHRNWDL